jgi:hypothetical protein
MFLEAEKVVSWSVWRTRYVATPHRKLRLKRKPVLLLSMPVFGRHAEVEKVWVRGQPQRVFLSSFRVRVEASTLL